MAYEFTRDATATFKFVEPNTLTIRGVNATLPSADSVVAGVYTLLDIGGLTEEDYYPIDAVRTVNEVVDDA